jgi:hypothetical protein
MTIIKGGRKSANEIVFDAIKPAVIALRQRDARTWALCDPSVDTQLIVNAVLGAFASEEYELKPKTDPEDDSAWLDATASQHTAQVADALYAKCNNYIDDIVAGLKTDMANRGSVDMDPISWCNTQRWFRTKVPDLGFTRALAVTALYRLARQR